MLGCNYPNDDNLLKTSILSQPPNTRYPPEGSLAYCIVIAKFLHVVPPLGNGSGRYSPFLGWRDQLSHGAKKKSVKKIDGYVVVNREDPNNQKKNPGRLPWEPFEFFSEISNFEELVPEETNSTPDGLDFQSQIFVQAMSPLLHKNELMSTNECV